ncbi:MAG: hypothetical protein ACOYLB_03630 [Phototrophicaceae bacterium]
MKSWVEFSITVVLCVLMFTTLEWVFGNYNPLTSNLGGVVIGIIVGVWGVWIAPTFRR